jgi:hypothetical protein
MEKKIFSILFALSTVLAFSQNEKIKTERGDGYTRTYVEYPNGQPTLCQFADLYIKYNLEKIVKTVNDKKITEYNLLLFRSGENENLKRKTKINKSHNKDIYVTIVFDDYTIVNGRPTKEDVGNFNGQVTIPIHNIERFGKRMIKSMVIKHTDTNDTNDVIMDYTTKAQFIGAKQLMDDANRIINYKQ